LNDRTIHKPKGDSSEYNRRYCTYQSSGYGPTYGGGHDLYICNNCNTSNSSYSNFGHTFDATPMTYG